MTIISPHGPSIIKIIKVNIWYIYPSSLSFYAFYAYRKKSEYSLERLSEAPILWPPDAQSQLIGKDPDAGKIEGRRRRG